MKRCPYCGKEYSNLDIKCAIDQTTLKSCPEKLENERTRPELGEDWMRIGASGRWLIFSGLPVAILGVLLTSLFRHGLDRGLVKLVGEKALPYVLFFTPVTIGLLGFILYKYLPKRILAPCGMVGWVVGLTLIYWYFWAGPGAFGHAR